MGDRVYADCMGKSLLLALIGEDPIEEGMNILDLLMWILLVLI